MGRYLEKYEALQKDFLGVEDLSVLEELSYNKARFFMIELIDEIKEYNLKNPNSKWRYSNTKTFRISKGFIIEKFNYDESYIFKKAKEELQLGL